MSTTHPTHVARATTRRTIRRPNLTGVALGAAVAIASVAGIAAARSGGGDPSVVPAAVSTAPAYTCQQLVQMGPAGNAALSDAALEQWRLLWAAARC